MKLLMLTDVFFPDTIGGAGRVAYHLCLELSRQGHEVHVITRKIKGALPSLECLSERLTIHRFLSPKQESLGLFFHELMNSYLLIKRIGEKNAFDIICIHQCMAAIGPLLSGCLKRIPGVYYFHSPWHEEYLIKKGDLDKKNNYKEIITAWIMRRIEKWMLSKASAVIVLSRFMRDRLVEIHHLPAYKIIKIPGGIDLNHFRIPPEAKVEVRKRMDLPLDKRIFITIRNLVPRMGLKNLINAYGVSDTLKNESMLMIGGQGPLENDLKNMVKNLNLNHSIRFLGHVLDNDLPEIYHASDFFVLPTEELEGFGLVILESMACGTPVLGTPVGAIPEVIGSFDKRLIFCGTGQEDLRKKMEEVIQHPDKYYFAPDSCRDYVKNRFSWRNVSAAFEKVVEDLFKESRPEQG